MASVEFTGVTCGDEALILTGTSDGVGKNYIWVHIGHEWHKAKVDKGTGDWTVTLGHGALEDVGVDAGDSLDITVGIYLNPAHRPHIGSHKVLADEGAFDTATLTHLEEDANLLVNGSFEDDFEETTPLEPNTWTIKEIPGWTGTNGGVEVWNDLVDHGPEASGGAQNIELDTDLRLDVLSQTVTTAAGAEYHLSFDYASRNVTEGEDNATDSFTVWWNGELVAELDPETVEWTTFSTTVTGTGSDTLEFREAGANDGLGALIDVVGLTAETACGGYILT